MISTMTCTRMAVTLFPLALAATSAACSAKPESPAAALVITGARVIDTASGSASPPRDVWIVGDEIRAVVAAGTRMPPAGASVVEGGGLFLLPGLIDVHAHIGNGGMVRNSDEDRVEALGQFLRYGVTTIFAPGGGGGNDEQLGEWKRRCGNGELRCPRLFGSGDLLTAPGSHPISTIFELPADTDAATLHPAGVTAVAENDPVEPILERKVAAGVDAIKIVVEDGPGPWYPKPRLSAPSPLAPR